MKAISQRRTMARDDSLIHRCDQCGYWVWDFDPCSACGRVS